MSEKVDLEIEDKIDHLWRRENSWWTWVWRGIVFGIGSTVGLVLLVYVAVLLANQLELIPGGVGQLAKDLSAILEQSVELRVPGAQKFLPHNGLETDAATQTVQDTAELYTLALPDDWITTIKEGARADQRSFLQAQSPDFKSRTEGSTVSYQTGASLSVLVTTTPTATTYPNLTQEKAITVAGQPASYRIYRDDATAEGRLLDARFEHQGNHYRLTLRYNPETYPNGPEGFDEILASVQLTEATDQALTED
ncbi:hypothetical protein HY375_03015 [Candidatus Berkelbacteria bacterium]|nr:hypothetical protein [Candidatus Berkelbacteria bacterium]